ncbi:MAG: cation transporting ATPase C-terminal domain-containing protein [Promethearchaeota archaeon]
MLALKLANCGIAMGIAGTDVAKEAADMVISDDNFTSIAKGVKIGRGIIAKIRMIIYFFICLNIMEATIFFFYEFVPFFNLFSSEWQHIYIYGIVHSLPSIGLVLDTHPKDVMKEPPKNTEDLLTGKMWMLLLIQAFLMGMGLVLILELTLNGVISLNNFNLDPNVSYFNPLSTNSELMAQKARTMFITTLYILETNFIWTFRRPNKSLFKSIKEEFNYALLFICWLTLGIHVMHIFFSYPVNNFINDVSGLNLNINFMYLSWSDWLLCILFALPGILGIEIVKFIARKRKIRF